MLPFRRTEPEVLTIVPGGAGPVEDLACFISQQRLGSSIQPGDQVIVRTNFDERDLADRSLVVIECSRRGLMLERWGIVKPLVEKGLATPPPRKTSFNIEVRGVAVAMVREFP